MIGRGGGGGGGGERCQKQFIIKGGWTMSKTIYYKILSGTYFVQTCR